MDIQQSTSLLDLDTLASPSRNAAAQAAKEIDPEAGDNIELDSPPRGGHENSSAPLRPHHQGIYWLSPITMVSLFFLGVFMSIGHYFYYSSLVGNVVGGIDDQQRALRCVWSQVPLVLEKKKKTSRRSAHQRNAVS
jgi:hypothetical protein